MSEKLKPCPFCGGQLGIAPEGGHADDCYIVMLLRRQHEPDELNAAWNRRELESASQPGGGEAEALAEDAARWRHIYNGRYVICRWSAEDKAYINIGGSYVGRDAIDALRTSPSAGNGGAEGGHE